MIENLLLRRQLESLEELFRATERLGRIGETLLANNHRIFPISFERFLASSSRSAKIKPIRRQVRFVLVKTGERMMILMCSDLTLNSQEGVQAVFFDTPSKRLRHSPVGLIFRLLVSRNHAFYWL